MLNNTLKFIRSVSLKKKKTVNGLEPISIILALFIEMSGALKKEERRIKMSSEMPYKFYLGEFYAFITLALFLALIYLCDAKIFGLRNYIINSMFS